MESGAAAAGGLKRWFAWLAWLLRDGMGWDGMLASAREGTPTTTKAGEMLVLGVDEEGGARGDREREKRGGGGSTGLEG